jgi:hypothetical protein
MIFFWPPIILALRHDFKALVPAFSRLSVSEKPSKRATERTAATRDFGGDGIDDNPFLCPFLRPGASFRRRKPRVLDTLNTNLWIRNVHWGLCAVVFFLGQPGLTTTDHTTPACFAAHVPSQAAVVHHRRLLFIVPTEVSRIEQERPLRPSAANVASILQNKTRRHGWYIRECVPHE